MADLKLIKNVIISEKIIGTIVDATINGIKEISEKFIYNYTIRRNVGFDVIPSLVDSYKDTKSYYGAILVGEDPPKEKVQAVYFK